MSGSSTDSLGDLIRKAGNASKGSDVRRTALEQLIQTSSSPSISSVSLIPQHLPSLVPDFPDLWPAGLDAAYDVSEHEDKNVRMQGYRLVVDLARIGVGAEEVGTMTDVLLQSMYTSHQDNSLEEINTLEQCIRSLIHLNPGAAIGLITSLLSKETNVPTKLIWDLIEGPANGDVEAWLGRAAGGEGEADEKRAVKENLFRVSRSRA
ncbi:hypothetical protein FFLO_06850 [Filobasidium floriforme]|uniref:Uncharacterized protein n=1 Tax=Filobasidium floriforme TaxID=5210 RepID=A0A8K0JEK9_9TREE|nr:hypothetical protein FFLO_06850 [Filobasidium floriforme]